jgi:crotonobetainyl-CoA:carnitine CoA-transferase CaiB-like acyl-CoA transferase
VVNTVAEAFKDPQVLHRGLQQTMKHAVAGPLSLVANPIRFSETPIEAPNPPPMLGEHTAEILKEVLGFDAAKIASLLERNVIGAARG